MIALALVLVALGAGDHDRSLLFGGTTRTYLVHVPPRVSEGRPLPRCPSGARTVEQRTAPSRGAPDQTATLLVWGPCAGGTEVQLWKLAGAGHGWPGGHVPLPEKIMGPDAATIDAALEVWRFVSRFRRSDAPALEAR